MGIFDDIAALISGAVGNNHENKPDDVIRVKRALNEKGLYDLSTPPEPHGYITQGMDDAIRAFQGEEGLKVDGYLLPGGETEAALKKTMREPAARETPEKPRAETSPLSFVNPLAAKRDEEAEDSRPVEYDASGRMIRPEERVPAFALSQTAAPRRRPREEKPAPEKPAELDATGRMIRSWGKDYYDDDVDKEAHYEEASGRALIYSSDRLDKRPVYRHAMEENKKRFEDSIVKGAVDGKSHPFKDEILSLKDGETTMLNKKGIPGGGDFWDRDIQRYEGVMGHGDYKQSKEEGSAKLRSTGTIRATRQGDTIHIDGVVDHQVNDVYDFNKDDPEFSHYRKKAETGQAKPYGTHASKLEQLKGTIRVQNGKIVDYEMDWQPVDRKSDR